MPTYRSRFGCLAAATALGACCLTSGSVAGQTGAPGSPVCGWPAPDAAAGPASLNAIEEGLADGTEYSARTARDGLAWLRRWIDECDATASRQAVLELQRAYDRTPSDPALGGALAIALARGVEVQPPGVEGHNYRSAYEQSNAEKQARRLFVEALEHWSSPELGEEFAALALATRDGQTLALAHGALASLAERVPGSASLWTARAEVAIALHRYDEAMEAAASASGLGDPSGGRAFGVVRLLVDDDPAEGGRLYLEGLASADEQALYRYHEDLSPLLSLAEESDWAAQSGGARNEWLRRK